MLSHSNSDLNNAPLADSFTLHLTVAQTRKSFLLQDPTSSLQTQGRRQENEGILQPISCLCTV